MTSKSILMETEKIRPWVGSGTCSSHIHVLMKKDYEKPLGMFKINPF